MTAHAGLAVTEVGFAAAEGPDSAIAADQVGCLTELAVVLGFNNKKISNDQVTSAIETRYDDKWPEDIFRSVDKLLVHFGSRLQVAFPSCFNPTWSKVSLQSGTCYTEPYTDHQSAHCSGWRTMRPTTPNCSAQSVGSSHAAPTRPQSKPWTASSRCALPGLVSSGDDQALG
jgi:hypothetical protein